MISIALISGILELSRCFVDRSVALISIYHSGMNPRPGEISLAHNGVLFLDELPEFDRRVLEALREPLENGHITVSRVAHSVDYPARFQLVAAMNPCPCGYLGHPTRACRCTPDRVARYRAKLSGPLLDRIDLCMEVSPLNAEALQMAPDGERSSEVRRRVVTAAALQHERQAKPNAHLDAAGVEAHCALDEPASALLRQAIERLGLSGRAYHRTLKVARTIADLAGAARIAVPHVAEALQYRRGLPEH
ncbi:ATP-binding protein [Uliginosibacterium sp. sgz301328]|uniref:ATP-binding protein n=1 Tax=Uliginosibacterium sp. sgz301328 TaxID=3243764 RepID=UPI00359ED240